MRYDEPGPIGIFDSGYGGLTILKEIRRRLPEYDYIYLGDNARAPYGARSFRLVYNFTLEAVNSLFERGCNLVVLACNTASAKALRSIQQNDLPGIDPRRRVLGIIRPTAEFIASTDCRHVAILATPGTARSGSYKIEINKLNPEIAVTEKGCPMWVPLVENGETHNEGTDFFVKKYINEVLDNDPKIDTFVLGCTHYPVLLPKIRQFAPSLIRIITQGELVADSLADYLERHPEMNRLCTRGSSVEFLTTEDSAKFDSLASIFMDHPVVSKKITLP